MSQPVISQIAQAVTDALNAAVAEQAFDAEFTAVRAYLPQYELPEMAELKVTVVPKQVVLTGGSRSAAQQDVAIDIAVQQRVDPQDLDAVDALMELVESIAGYLRTRRLDLDGLHASWLSAEHEPIYAPEHMEQMNQFTSILTVTYRLLN